MSGSSQEERVRPHPFTPRGVAGFAGIRLGRMLLWQAVAALAAGAAVAAVFRMAWVPVIEQAIAAVPERAVIGQGRLDWPGNSPVLLAENRFLSLGVALEPGHASARASDLQIEAARDGLRISSLFGFFEAPYPPGWSIDLARSSSEPWWGSRRPLIVAGLAGVAMVGVWASWVFLAFLYAVPVQLIALYADRRLTFGGAWKLSAAALLPGALLMSGALLLYGSHRLGLIGLLIALALHIPVGWVYLFAAPARLPPAPDRVVGGVKSNPFDPKKERAAPENPFKRGGTG